MEELKRLEHMKDNFLEMSKEEYKWEIDTLNLAINKIKGLNETNERLSHANQLTIELEEK